MKSTLLRRVALLSLSGMLVWASLSPVALAAPSPWKGQPMPVVSVEESELDTLRAAAESGDAAAQVRLGHYYMDHYEDGLANEAKAGEWFRQAAEAGHAEGEAWYAVYLFITHPGSSKEAEAAAEPWAGKAAGQGHAIGLYLMGMMTPRTDRDTRKDWFLPAARQGFVPAMRAYAATLLSDHEHPMEDKKDPVVKEAFKWLEKAARSKDCSALMVASGSEGRRESFGFGQKTLVHPLRESEKFAKAAIAAAIQRRWQWYDTVFDFDMLLRRYSPGGVRNYQVIRAYLNLHTLYSFKKEEKKAEKVPGQLVATLRKLAKNDPVAANYALAQLLSNWSNFYFPSVPETGEDYKVYARKAAEAEPVNYCDYEFRRRAAEM